MMVGDWVSFSSGVALVVFGSLAMIAYWPKLRARWDAPDILGFAIWLGFLAAVWNTLYWQVFGQIAVFYEWASVSELRHWGDWADLLFKGGGAVAGILHITARHRQLPEDERKLWHWIEMPWHPERRECLRRLLRRK